MSRKHVVVAFLFGLLLMLVALPALALTITVDGDKVDWGAQAPLITDGDEPLITDKWDINEVYVNNNSVNLFVRFNTLANTEWQSNTEFFYLCLDTDNNTGTGGSISQCASMTGVDFIFRAVNGNIINLRSCVAGNTNFGQCTAVAGAVLAAGTEVTHPGIGTADENEFSVRLSDLGITEAGSCGGGSFTVKANIYFDNSDTDPDDNVPNSGTVNLPIDCVALAVRLNSFDATSVAEGIRVNWATSSEVNNVGFNLYRSTDSVRPTTPLNSAMIEAQAPGSGQGANYTYTDSNVTAGTTYYYWLEDVESTGSATVHGPVTVVVNTPTAVTLNNLSTSTSTMPWMVAGAVLLGAAGLLLARRRRA